MNSTKVARRTRTIFKLIGPCEILSHGQKEESIYHYKHIPRIFQLVLTTTGEVAKTMIYPLI